MTERVPHMPKKLSKIKFRGSFMTNDKTIGGVRISDCLIMIYELNRKSNLLLQIFEFLFGG